MEECHPGRSLSGVMDMDREDHQTVIEILAERLLLYHLLEITVLAEAGHPLLPAFSADQLKFLLL